MQNKFIKFFKDFNNKADLDSLVKFILWAIFFALLIFTVYYILKGVGII